MSYSKRVSPELARKLKKDMENPSKFSETPDPDVERICVGTYEKANRKKTRNGSLILFSQP